MMNLHLSQDQFDSDVKLLEAKGLKISGTQGTLEADGCTVAYKYEDGVLSLNVTKKPFFLSETSIERIITTWFNNPIPPAEELVAQTETQAPAPVA